jgi:hypothetical protein
MSKPLRVCIHCADDWDEQDINVDFDSWPCPTCGEETYTLETLCDMANAYLSSLNTEEDYITNV